MPTAQEIQDAALPIHDAVLYVADGFGPQHARQGKNKFGVQCTGNSVAGETFFTTIPVKKGSLIRRSAAFREFNSDLKEELGRNWKRTCFLDGSSEITVLYWNRHPFFIGRGRKALTLT